MPDLLKAITEKYGVKAVKVFRFDETEDGVRYAFYGRGKLNDDAPKELKENYNDLAKKGMLFVWKFPKGILDMAKRVGYAFREGMPSEEESFYKLVYVFAPEVDAEQAASALHTDFLDDDDHILALQAQDLGYLFKRKE
jgi:hypothetical protein